MHAYNFSNWKGEAVKIRNGIQGHPQLHREFDVSLRYMRLYFKKKKSTSQPTPKQKPFNIDQMDSAENMQKIPFKIYTIYIFLSSSWGLL